MTKETKEQVKRTPGPWSIGKLGDNITIWFINDVGGENQICQMTNCDEQHNEANASLIAAVPELLLVAKSHLDFCGFKNCPTCKLAESAMAKAKGE